MESNSPVKKKSGFNKDWTQGPILGNLLLLSWPMAAMETFFVISQVLDMVWVGRLGPSAIAGLGVAITVTMLVTSMDFGLVVGARAMVARYIGAGDTATANHIAAQALILGVGWGLLMTVLGLTLTRPVMGLFGMDPEMIADGVVYMRITFAGWVTMDVMIIVLYIVQSSGDVMRPLVIETLTRIVHIGLCPLLVLGLWIFPRMGVGGAALASVIGQVVGAALALGLLFSGSTRLHVTRKDFRLDLNIIGRILKIGFPALLTNFQRSFGAFVVTLLMAPFGTIAMAAHSLESRVEMFVLLPGFGLGMGAGVLVGQNLGARQPGRAEKSAWTATIVLESLMVVIATVMLLWADGVISLFTTDPELIKMGAMFLRIASGTFYTVAFTSILQSCVSGAGDTVPALVISLISNWAVQVLLALWLPHVHGLGAVGIRWAMVAGVMASSLIYIAYFRLGKWKLKGV